MKSTSFIKIKIETIVQSIAVVVITEYQKGEIPNIYTSSVSTQVNHKCFNVNLRLNVSEQDMLVNISGNVPVGFLADLEAEMMAAHEFVMKEINV